MLMIREDMSSQNQLKMFIGLLSVFTNIFQISKFQNRPILGEFERSFSMKDVYNSIKL